MKLLIDGKTIETAEGSTILAAAEENGIHIPTLCWLREINAISVCRVCLVEADGKLVPACSTAAREGMAVVTGSERVRAGRRKNLELICSDHAMDCTDCPRGADCELRELCREYEVDDRAFGLGKRKAMVDESTPYLVRDNAKCILCRRCEAVCSRIQGIKALSANQKGGDTNVGFGLPLAETDCVGCGQCAAACPTGALTPKDGTKAVWKAIFDKESFVIAAVSPSAYRRIGELFGQAPETDCGGKTAALLRKLGFDAVFDLAGPESEQERAVRELVPAAGGSVLSGVCPAWRRYAERFHPELRERLIVPASGRERLAAACRDRAGDKRIFAVRISNCVAAKGGDSDFDGELSTRELFQLIRRACVSGFTAQKVWEKLEGETFDALPPLPAGRERELRVLSVSGLAEAERALAAAEDYDLVCVRACPGGCLYGGGMPRPKDGKKGAGVPSP